MTPTDIPPILSMFSHLSCRFIFNHVTPSLLCILLSLLRPLIVTSAAIQSTTDNLSLAIAANNRSILLPPSGSNSSALDATLDRDSRCGNPYTWHYPLFQPSDCQGALDWLFLEEMHMLQHQKYEFLSYGATPRSKLPSLQTPRKYTFRMF